ncbi:DUF1559 domain-containing protein [bacterium]|nr:DUF1559 domain-containing protein [bacterium]
MSWLTSRDIIATLRLLRMIAGTVSCKTKLGVPTSGFSLVELMIVISVVSLLLALSFPAIISAVSSVRRTQCQSNLRQIGLALSSYEVVHGTYPPAGVWSPGGVVLATGGPFLPGTVDLSGPKSDWKQDRFISGFFIHLLPNLEEQQVFQSWNFDTPVSSPENLAARSTRIAAFTCPSDRQAVSGAPCSLAGGGWARGSYGVNAGPSLPCLVNSDLPSAMKAWTCKSIYPDLPNRLGIEVSPLHPLTVHELWGAGIAGLNKCFSSRDIRDGLSKTVAIDELRAGLTASDRRGTWAMPAIGASVTFAHGQFSPGGGRPNSCYSSDRVQDCTMPSDMHTCFPCESIAGISAKANARSEHPGGVNVLYLDGSIDFISDMIDLNTWTAMHTRDAQDSTDRGE